ncbi:hypothetical protein C1T17_12475 [Sphingobium sp. SCG-1]|uniref:GntR family transcriptional regulator n=1 Tax=Sphingobium sp. SCG-1 TaxID=2072936 RepID=UPI000CD6A78D|nr:GntR family transcriptional regulator [Sphingobium sp. SCG-1]AUW58787.1 hypothetical protein C1T17_12475 [Sphingobium sp. SCG-1]
MTRTISGLGTRGVVVAQWIRERIINGTFAPEEHLQEQVLAEQSGTSRTPVREALKLMEHEQLVVYSPNRGYVVRRFAIEDITNAFEVRATLEGMVCRVVAHRGVSEAGTSMLKRLLRRMQPIAYSEEWGNEDSLEWFDLNAQFHQVLIEEARNPVLADTIQRTQRLPLIFDAQFRLRNPSQVSRLFAAEDTQRSYQEHVSLFALIEERRGIEAEALMRQHIEQSKEAIRAKFAQIYPCAQ